MSGYTKLFSTITDSTIWQEPDSTRLVWITMLAIADQHGYVGASMPGLAARARVSLDDCIKAIDCLLAPDKWSRTTEYEGRRIVATDGGWTLLNHAKYREIQDAERRREQSRLAMQRLRSKAKEPLANVSNVDVVNVGSHSLTQAEAEASLTKVSVAKRVSRKTRMPENFGISERVRKWSSEKGFDRLDEHLESFVSKARAAGYRYVDWDEALMNAIRDNWAKLGSITAPQRVKFQSNDWMRDDIALERRAGELGVTAYPGEDYAALRQRVIARAQIQ